MKASLLNPLRERNFAALFASTVVSSLGDWLDLVALLVLVSVVWHLGAPGLAAVALAQTVPMLGAPLIGVLADRLPPRRVMIVSDVARLGLTAGLVAAGGLWILVALVAGRAIFGVGFNSASQLLIRRSVPQAQLVAANALNQATVQAVKVFGPAVGGLLVAALSPRAVFAVNAVSFALSAAALTMVRTPSAATVTGPQHSRHTIWGDMAEGMRYVLRTPILAVTCATMGVLSFVVFLYDSISPLAVLGLGLDRSYVGYLLAAVGIGGAAGAVLLGQLGTVRRPFFLMGPAVCIIGAAVAAIGVGVANSLRVGPVPWLVTVGILGVASSGVLVPYPVILQTSTPERLSGRVWATMSAIPSVLNVLAPACAVGLVEVFGVGPTFLIAGAALAGFGLLVSLALGRRQLTGTSEPEPGPGGPQAPVGPGGAGNIRSRPGRNRQRRLREEVKHMSDKLAQLAEAGFQLSAANDAQRGVLESLSDDEVSVLLSIKQRVDAVGSEVEGHAGEGGSSGGWLW